jgi:hypothetical protein
VTTFVRRLLVSTSRSAKDCRERKWLRTMTDNIVQREEANLNEHFGIRTKALTSWVCPIRRVRVR